MKKTNSIFVCQQCGFKSPQYLGRCPNCDTWNSLVEEIELPESRANPPAGGLNSRVKGQIINLREIDGKEHHRLNSGIDEFDRVLGGGVVAGSVVLLAGDPGIGKSTLLLQIALNIENQTSKVLYISGEESAKQIKLRADRINKNASLQVLNEVDIDVISLVIEEIKPSLVIVDSIQTMETADLTQAAGSISQVRECAQRLQRLSKGINIPIFLVGHVTKEGTVAGPRTLEHLVDVVLNLEGDPASQFRILRAAKNRFGATDETGIFEMAETGMMEIKNPSKLFLESKIQAPGSAVVAVMTGIRPLLLEIQALVTKSNLPIPRRSGSGVDFNRLQLLVAVLQKRLDLPLFAADIFVNATGGLKVTEPAADLGICMAIISSFKNSLIPAKTVFVGEVGLLGEIRAVKALQQRIKEAKKLGFSSIISFQNTKTLSQAVKILGI